ncbi:MAG TPA: hypothetical protein VND45_16505, partial [Thermoanaerobaculia bacterium]|nr:hypothetical protein [Thermoanaerobaculia bacterium]
MSHRILPARDVRSLAWVGDSLIDVVAGGTRYELHGESTRGSVRWAYPFDAAVTAPGSDFAVLYTRLGTKALLLKNGQLVRELNRSFYHAHRYEYPICLVPRGERTLLIHCPEVYNRLEIEDAESGERLTARKTKQEDFFHSRLTPNPSGTTLASAGWVWQPLNAIAYFSIDDALRDPAHLDASDWAAPHSANLSYAEENSICWLDDRRAVVTATGEPEEPDDDATTPRLLPNGVIVYDTSARAVLSSVVLDQPAGNVVAVDDTHVIALFEHPRLVSLTDGRVEQEWPELATGRQASSIVDVEQLPPAYAFDRRTRRLAVAQQDGIHVI